MDPFVQASGEIGADFANFVPLTALVTVTQIDPDTDTNTTAAGVALGSAANVPALKRSRRRQPFGVGTGELGRDTCRFVFAASAVSWVLKARDQIADADGNVWVIDRAELIAFNQLAACDVTIKR